MLLPRCVSELRRFTDPGSSRYALGALQIERAADGRACVVACDGRRLAAITFDDRAELAEYPAGGGISAAARATFSALVDPAPLVDLFRGHKLKARHKPILDRVALDETATRDDCVPMGATDLETIRRISPRQHDGRFPHWRDVIAAPRPINAAEFDAAATSAESARRELVDAARAVDDLAGALAAGIGAELAAERARTVAHRLRGGLETLSNAVHSLQCGRGAGARITLDAAYLAEACQAAAAVLAGGETRGVDIYVPLDGDKPVRLSTRNAASGVQFDAVVMPLCGKQAGDSSPAAAPALPAAVDVPKTLVDAVESAAELAVAERLAAEVSPPLSRAAQIERGPLLAELLAAAAVDAAARHGAAALAVDPALSAASLAADLAGIVGRAVGAVDLLPALAGAERTADGPQLGADTARELARRAVGRLAGTIRELAALRTWALADRAAATSQIDTIDSGRRMLERRADDIRAAYGRADGAAVDKLHRLELRADRLGEQVDHAAELVETWRAAAAAVDSAPTAQGYWAQAAALAALADPADQLLKSAAKLAVDVKAAVDQLPAVDPAPVDPAPADPAADPAPVDPPAELPHVDFAAAAAVDLAAELAAAFTGAPAAVDSFPAPVEPSALPERPAAPPSAAPPTVDPVSAITF